MARCILHIGTEKTATTSVQQTLFANIDRLAEHKIVYPRLGPQVPHSGLVVYVAQNKSRVEDLFVDAGFPIGGSVRAFEGRMQRMLDAATRAAPDALFILSTEHAHSRLLDPAEVRRLRKFLRRYFDDIEIVVYLRRWDRVARSHYSTGLKNGETRAFDFAAYRDGPYLDYAGLLDRWSAAFGADKLSVAIYEDAIRDGGSVVADFCRRFALPALVEETRFNRAIPTHYHSLLRRINLALAGTPPRQAQFVRHALTAAIESRTTASEERSTEADRRFVAAFRDQARYICDTYLNGRHKLFDAVKRSPPPGKGAAADDDEGIMLDCLEQLSRDLLTRSVEAHYYRAAFGQATGRGDEAVEAAIDAVNLDPANDVVAGLLGHLSSPDGVREMRDAAVRRQLSSEDALAAIVEHSPLFDVRWYYKSHPRLPRGINLARHYLTTGAREGLDPGPAFSTRGYLTRYPDVSIDEVNPLVHFILHGEAQGRDVSPPED